ncbi:hypothetical protein K8W59_19980 [Nocardioides rotundus]|uniref:thiamine pyrophosphate-dependent enzyme n=1 Tax=Nocardioides rotundus TaxID=1774216 RepID=UPI001CC086BC|nr:thiamine pyrophosphate-dependent enzyme [Nocardioides rotundus]UAL29966.1 hypothetical protein K8W59_19980 [Nocardioides rotundus]
MADRLVGHAVVEQLIALGADRTYGVPGESYLAVLDGLYDHPTELPFVVCRQEGGAAMMAAAHGQVTGRPGVAMVTRGPGATNASAGVHVAAQDGSPMLLLVGQVPTSETGDRGFQEVDYDAMLAGLAKEVVTLDRPDRACELVVRAWSVAASGHPGPVVLVMPEDVLSAPAADRVRPAPGPVVSAPPSVAVSEIRERLAAAERPLVVVSGTAWSAEGRTALRELAEGGRLPVATAARRQDLLDNRSDAFAGTLGLATTPGLPELAAEADTVLLLGSAPDGLTAEDGDWLADRPDRTLLQVHPDAGVPNRVHRTDLAVLARPDETAVALAAVPLPESSARTEWCARLRENRVRARSAPAEEGSPAAFMAVLNEEVADDAILTAGAGVYTGWHQRHHEYVAYPSQVATQSGSMGYGLPAAIAAAKEFPGREVVAFAGDGCFLMTGQELATAVGQGLDLTVIVVVNGVYGTIRQHQERRFPGRPSGTALRNPDFVALARAYGAWAETARTPDELGAALRARPAGVRLIQVLVE